MFRRPALGCDDCVVITIAPVDERPGELSARSPSRSRKQQRGVFLKPPEGVASHKCASAGDCRYLRKWSAMALAATASCKTGTSTPWESLAILLHPLASLGKNRFNGAERLECTRDPPRVLSIDPSAPAGPAFGTLSSRQ